MQLCDGKISIPYIGSVDLAGRTLQEGERSIEVRLREYYKHPQVTLRVMEYSKPGVGVDKWTTPADGAQSAVTIRRLADSESGASRVAVDHPSLKIFTPSGGRYLPWSATLERGRGGWHVMDTIKHKG